MLLKKSQFKDLLAKKKFSDLSIRPYDVLKDHYGHMPGLCFFTTT